MNRTNLGFEYFAKPLTNRRRCEKYSKPLKEICSIYFRQTTKEESSEETTWIYESFSNFSSDKLSRKKSMKIALEGLLRARSDLENKGIEVQQKSGMDVTNWVPCQEKKTMILYCYE